MIDELVYLAITLFQFISSTNINTTIQSSYESNDLYTNVDLV